MHFHIKLLLDFCKELNDTFSIQLILVHLVTGKWFILEFMFTENHNYYPITYLINGRRPMINVISTQHSADITREIQHILVTKCPKMSETEEVYDKIIVIPNFPEF